MTTLKEKIRRGDWIQTYSGNQFWPLDPDPTQVHIVDIARSLSMQCRYNGHCTMFYSIAEHSIVVSKFIEPEHALWGLLHDASEAYTADIPGPLKKDMPEFKRIEARIMEAICWRFGIPVEEPKEVKRTDLAVLHTEYNQIILHRHPWQELTVPPVVTKLACYGPYDVFNKFMDRFTELRKES